MTRQEWLRGPAWASEAARRTWEPRIRQIAEAWAVAEIASVFEGVRPSALVLLTPDALADLTRRAVPRGLHLVPLAGARVSDTYAAKCARRGAQGFRAALTAGDPVEWLEAWAAGDDDAVGALLGFPTCCRAFFSRTWGAGQLDTTWAQAQAGIPICVAGPVPAERFEVLGPPEASVLLRWLGVRLAPHLPCSFACEASAELGRAMAALLPPHIAAWVYELLDAPTSWTSINGAAEVVVGGLLKFAAATDFAPGRREVHRQGSGRVPDVAMPSVEASEPSSWADNGFATEAAMLAAHEVVARAVGDVDSALDLGCGDGALLARLAERRSGGSWFGLECDAGRVFRGRLRHGAGGVSMQLGRIGGHSWGDESIQAFVFDNQRLDVVLLMPGRLLEMREAEAARMRESLPSFTRRVVLYAYGDWLTRYPDGLAGLAAAAGFARLGQIHRGSGVEAAEAMQAHQPCGCCRNPWCDGTVGGLHHHDGAPQEVA